LVSTPTSLDPGGFSRGAARAHSTLRCTVSPHGPLRVAYPIFGSPWASCPHLVLTRSPQFASIFFVPIPPRFPLILSITQRVPILFQHRAHAVNPYSITCFKSMSPFHYFLYILTLYSRLSYLVPIAYPVSSNATSPKALFPSPTSFPPLLLFT
jgi:hypothetical protein